MKFYRLHVVSILHVRDINAAVDSGNAVHLIVPFTS